MAAILVTFMLALGAAPTRGSATATADDTARFLAGLPLSSNSPLAAFANTPAWMSHARNLDSVFAREESFQLSKVREFSKKYLTDKHDTMLYMFSGPDFSLRDLVFSERLNVRFSRSRTGGLSPRPDEAQPLGYRWGIAKS